MTHQPLKEDDPPLFFNDKFRHMGALLCCCCALSKERIGHVWHWHHQLQLVCSHAAPGSPGWHNKPCAGAPCRPGYTPGPVWHGCDLLRKLSIPRHCREGQQAPVDTSHGIPASRTSRSVFSVIDRYSNFFSTYLHYVNGTALPKLSNFGIFRTFLELQILTGGT